MFLFGIFWLPKNIEDYGEAAAPWARLSEVVDQNAALWIFAAALFGYVAWIDARPYVRKRFNPKSPIIVYDQIYCTRHWIEAVDDDGRKSSHDGPECLFRLYLQVTNDMRDAKTLRNLRATVRIGGSHFRLNFKGDREAIDLHRGELDFLQVGTTISDISQGTNEGGRVTVPTYQISNFRNSGSHNYRSIEIGDKFGIGTRKDLPMSVNVTLSADDILPLHLVVTFDGWADSPYKMVAVRRL